MIARLETERLILRPLTPDDTDALVELDSDPEVMRHLTGGTPRLHHRWVIFDRTNAEFLGWVSLRPVDAAGVDCELGYRSAKPREAEELPPKPPAP